MRPILLIGKGRVGTSLSSCLRERKISFIHKRGREDFLADLPKTNLVLIAVKDDAIQEIAKTIHHSRALKPGSALAHFSGALSSKILKAKGYYAFSIHPLKSFAFPKGRCSDFQGIPFVFEGDQQTIKIAKQLIKKLGGEWVEIQGKDKILYHTAACAASNFLVTLVSMASDLIQKTGILEKNRRFKATHLFLIPLLKSAIENIEKIGIPGALTGPIERGDFSTVKKQIEALKKRAPNLLEVYKILSLKTLSLAVQKGLSQKEANLLKKLLKS